jgi:hypothetical protein
MICVILIVILLAVNLSHQNKNNEQQEDIYH